MYADLDGGLRDLVSLRCFRRRQTVNFHVTNEAPGFLRKPLQEAIDVYLSFDRVGIGKREQLTWIVERILGSAFRTAKMIDQFVSRDCVYPRRERPRRIVGRSSRVHSDQCFLQQVFGVGRTTRSKTAQIVGS